MMHWKPHEYLTHFLEVFNFDMGFPIGQVNVPHHRTTLIPALGVRGPEGGDPMGTEGAAAPCQQGELADKK